MHDKTCARHNLQSHCFSYCFVLCLSQELDALPTLKALQALTEDKLELVDPSTMEYAIVEPKKVKAIGLIDFPARCAELM